MKYDRLSELRRYIIREKQITSETVCTKFGVSPATARRDFTTLEKEGLIRRTHGGAELVSYDREEYLQEIIPRWKKRHNVHETEKRSIAAVAASLIPDGSTVFLDSGTTVYEIARQLLRRERLTVITSSLRNAALLSTSGNIDTYLIGGIVKADNLYTTGILAAQCMSFFPSIDICVISADGFKRGTGPAEWSNEAAGIKKIAVSNAATVITVLDHHKFEVNAPSPICSLQSIDVFITDDKTEESYLEEFRRKKVRVIIASPCN